MKKKEIYLIDGSAYLYRAFHAIPSLTTSCGTPTNAIFGVTMMLLKLMKERQPQYSAIFFDVKGPTFRHEMYDKYKANRSSMPDELIAQIPSIKEIVRALNIPILEKEGFEADDLIGTFARMAEERGWSAVMVTADKDFMQLVTDQCVIWDPMKDKSVDKESIWKEFSIMPDQIVEMMGLSGDVSDNIPGVPGVGPKTALKLIHDYGTIQKIYDNLEELKSKKALYKNLAENREQALLSRKLVTIDRFVDDIPNEIEEFKVQPYDREKLAELFKTFEFKKLHQEFFHEKQSSVEKDYRCLTDIREIESLVREIREFVSIKISHSVSGLQTIENSQSVSGLQTIENSQSVSGLQTIENSQSVRGSKRVAIDTETTSLSPMLAELVGISISFKPHQAFYIPVGHVERNSSTSAEKSSVPELFQIAEPKSEEKISEQKKRALQPDKQAVLNILKPLLEDPSVEKVGQNIKYDYIVLARNGIHMQGLAFDTMIASYLLNPSGRGHGLDQIALDLLGHKNITYAEVTTADSGRGDLQPATFSSDDSGQTGSERRESGKSRGRQQLLFSEVSIEKATDYACEDADVTLLVHDILKKKIEESHLEELMQTIEMPLIPVLAKMEMSGIRVDIEKLSSLSRGFELELEQLESKIFAIAGEKFNINSSQQLGAILFEKLKLPVQKKTKKRTGYSTDLSVLTELAQHHELPAMILRYRSLGKLKSTYTDALQELIHPETGRIHTSFNQAITATGRLSSSDPNLQNIPIRTEEGRRIRGAFIPDRGCKLVAADYSQIELRILAHVADDKILIEAFANDEDIHTRTAAEVFQAMPGLIDAELRRQAKAINFGIVYGMGAFKLSNELSISRKMAQTYIDNYFARYSGVKRYIDSTIEKAKERGEVTTLLGRRRRLDDINSPNANIRGLAERMAINTPIQGSAADLIKLAMIRMDRALNETLLPDGEKMASRMLLSVHDEILFEVPEVEIEPLTALAKSIMEGVFKLKVPLKVNIDSGDNWAEAH